MNLNSAGARKGRGKVANRIVMGLVLAALIIGASMMMNIDAPFKIFGHPALALMLFMVAVGGGFFMLYAIIFKDEN